MVASPTPGLGKTALWDILGQGVIKMRLNAIFTMGLGHVIHAPQLGSIYVLVARARPELSAF